MLKLPQFVLKRLAHQPAPSVDHPDANALASFSEMNLSGRERSDVLVHLAQCATCREVVVLASAPDGIEPNSVPSPAAARQSAQNWRPLFWTAPAALACLIASMIWIQSIDRQPSLPILDRHIHFQPAAPVETLSEQAKAVAETPSPNVPKKVVKQRLRSRPANAKVAKVEQMAFAGSSTETKPRMQAQSPVISASTAQALATQPFLAPEPPPIGIAAPALPHEPSLQTTMAHSLLASVPVTPRTLWSLVPLPADSIGSSGNIARSYDDGKTWQSIHVADNVRLCALSANGANVWVGGVNGVLFHSPDSGLHWNSVVVDDGPVRLSGTITRIQEIGANSIKLTVQLEASWISIDGGRRWNRQ